MQQQPKGSKEEQVYFLSVLSTLKSYREQSLLRLKNKQLCLETLPQRHKKWLHKYKEDLEQFRQCIETNSLLIPIVLEHAHSVFHNIYCNDTSHLEAEVKTLPEGLDKVQSVFKQLMRDWSSMGAAERAECYDPIIEEIEQNFPADKFNREDINVLVPGAGLGRLAFEVASRGFTCQGNEFNMFMLIVSYYVLNVQKKVNHLKIYPWIHQYCNNITAEVQMTSVSFPDVKPENSIHHDKFSMTAGDFLEVYLTENEWHVVATCFFIDCAQNVVEFLETIYNILKPGGLWVNLGPLLYHYADLRNETSVEPSFEVLCDVIKSVGFEMEKCTTGVKTRYCQNPKSLLQYEYDSVFFVCRKPIKIDDSQQSTEESLEPSSKVEDPVVEPVLNGEAESKQEQEESS